MRPVPTAQRGLMARYNTLGCCCTSGVWTALLTSSAARQMSFNPRSAPVVQPGGTAAKFTLLSVTRAAWENEKYASAWSARTQARMWWEHQSSALRTKRRRGQRAVGPTGMKSTGTYRAFTGTFPLRYCAFPSLSTQGRMRMWERALGRRRELIQMPSLRSPNLPGAAGRWTWRRLHCLSNSSMWSPADYDYSPYVSSIRLELDFFPPEEQHLERLVCWLWFFFFSLNLWMQQTTDWSTDTGSGGRSTQLCYEPCIQNR